MAAPTANEIRAQLKTLLTTPLATGKKAKIIDYLAFAFKAGDQEDPTVLRSSLDPTTTVAGATVNRINCLMISDDRFTQAPAQEDATRRITYPAGRNLITRRFRLTYFYQFGSASEITFSTNLEVIRTTLNSNPKLGFAELTAGKAGPAQFVHSHERLQMDMYPDAFGDTIVHVGDGILTVKLIEPTGVL